MRARRWLTLKNYVGSLLFLILLGLAFGSINGAASDNQACPNPAFPQPKVRRSDHGVLHTKLHARTADNKLVDQFSCKTRIVHTPTFDGTIPGPTLSVKPGDTLAIGLFNDLPANPKVQRKGFFPHDPYSINLHTRGLEVSPLGKSDNIFRKMRPGTKHHVEVHIP